VTDRYLQVREVGERFLDTYRRVGFETFKEAIYSPVPATDGGAK